MAQKFNLNFGALANRRIGDITIADGALDGVHAWCDKHLIYGRFNDTDMYDNGTDARVIGAQNVNDETVQLTVEIGQQQTTWQITREGRLTDANGTSLCHH